MEQTSLTLLDRIKRGDKAAWQHFDAIYRPFLQRWLAQRGISSHDREDLSQAVMLIAFKELHRFEHRGGVGSFRCWLRTTLARECSRWGRQRKRQACIELGDALGRNDDAIARLWDAEHDAWLFQQLIPRVKAGVEEQTWRAFELTKLQERDPKDVATELGIRVNNVHVACSRVLARFRKEGGEFLD